MNPNRQKQKYEELCYRGKTWVLIEEAEVFRTMLQARGLVVVEEKQTAYHIKFKRGPFK